MNQPELNADDAVLLCEALDVYWLLEEERELEKIEQHRPDFLRALEKLKALADSR